MATRTESLIGRLSIQDAEWKAGLARAATQFKQFSASVGKNLATGITSGLSALKSVGGMIGSAIGGVSRLLGELGGIGGVLSAAGIVAGIKNVSDLGGELSDVSARTGIAIDSLVVLREQFRQGGIDAGSVTTYVKKMNEALLDTGKMDLFRGLGLDQAKLLAKQPVDAINDIIKQIRKLKTVAGQQKALKEIFGKQGIEMMTLVADPNSETNALKMVGRLKDIMREHAADFDTISDLFFGGIPVKIIQAFAGLASAIKEPLLAASDWVATMDFTKVGENLGKQLIYVWNLFSGLWQQGTLGEYLYTQIEIAALKGGRILSAVLSSAMQAAFSDRNMKMLFGAFLIVRDTIIATVDELLAELAKTLGRIPKSWALQDSAEEARNRVKANTETFLKGLPSTLDQTGKTFIDSLSKELQDISKRDAEAANPQPKLYALPGVPGAPEDTQRKFIDDMIYKLGRESRLMKAGAGVEIQGPIKSLKDLTPEATKLEKSMEPLSKAAQEATNSLSMFSRGMSAGKGGASGSGGGTAGKAVNPDEPQRGGTIPYEERAKAAIDVMNQAKSQLENAKEMYLRGAGSLQEVANAMRAVREATAEAGRAALSLQGEVSRQEKNNAGQWGRIAKLQQLEQESKRMEHGGGYMRRGNNLVVMGDQLDAARAVMKGDTVGNPNKLSVVKLDSTAINIQQEQLNALNKLVQNSNATTVE